MRTKAPVCFRDLCEAWGTLDLAFHAFVSGAHYFSENTNEE